MKKLLMCALLATAALGTEEESIADNIKDVLGQFGEAFMAPVIIVKDATVKATKAVAESSIGQNAKEIAEQLFVDLPQQIATGAQEAATSIKEGTTKAYEVTAAAVKKAGQKVQDATTTATTAVKNAAQETATALKNVGTEIKDTAIEMGQIVKENAIAVANSEAGQDIKEVAEQFAAVPGQIVEDIKDLGNTVTRKVSAGWKAACDA